MAENRRTGNNRLDPPDKGRGYFDQSLSFNKFNLPILNEGWNSYILTIDNNGIVSLVANTSGNGFPYTGSAQITGSLQLSGSLYLNQLSNLPQLYYLACHQHHFFLNFSKTIII